MRTQPLVILVDDEDAFLEITSLKLQGKGFLTVATNDPYIAIEKAETLQPDLVLSDIYMEPGPSGWELALELRRNPKTHSIKLAFFTSLADPWMDMTSDVRAKVSAELGKITVLNKIVDMNDLPTKISELVHTS